MTSLNWGMFPKIPNTLIQSDREEDLRQIIATHTPVLPYGNGMSYGDSVLCENLVDIRPHHYFLGFDDTKGILHVQSGVLLSEILDVFLPRGWFLKIAPGTKYITVGGAIASDVHGKNHHNTGCFSEHVEGLRLLLPDGEVACCSKQHNSELFKATCGGMGLTGIVLDASISLMRIHSRYISQTTIKTANLKEAFDAFNTYETAAYSVAWIDCLARGASLGRCLLMTGDFCNDGDLNYKSGTKVTIPFNLPGITLNPWSVRAFNQLYYSRVRRSPSRQKVDVGAFFFPLDAIRNWNRVYGRNGFIQYQFILPKSTSYEGMRTVLEIVAESGRGSFLAVLKLHGPANDNFLSFPMEGYSLALDFKVGKGLLDLLDRLDEVVVQHGGRLYLAKDARVSQKVFEQGYPQIERFRALRHKYKMNEKFNSKQSLRVGI